MKQTISVIICTHNPRRDYLDKVLRALQAQTLPIEKWELLLVDNASNQLLSSEIDISWHPNSRHIREEQIGLTPARLRGIKEAVAETLVFVDDDNVLDSDYLEIALQIGKDYPFVGAWGGQIRPEFEVTPPEWTKPYWGYLAIREFEKDKWSNLNQHEAAPCGAGMCVRKIVAKKYADRVNYDSKRLSLGRKGQLLLGGEDSDLAFTACDIGLGTGQFTSLRLTHLIPASRLTEEYLVRLVEGITYSHIILDSFRDKTSISPMTSWKKILAFFRLWTMNPKKRPLYKARKRAEALAFQVILKSQESAIA